MCEAVEKYAQEVAEEREKKAEREEKKRRKRGEKRGISRGEILKIIKITVKKVQKGYTMEVVAEDLEESVDTLRPIYEAVEKAAPDYDAEKIYESLDK